MSTELRQRIGFVGLGKMGTPICRHLAAAGHEVTAFVRNAAGREKARLLGVRTAETLSSLASSSDIVVSAILDDAALADIVAGEGGLARALRPGSTLIETSTVSPNASASAASLLAATGVTYLRSPVSGSTATAEAAALTVLVSGPRAGFEANLPIYATFSKKQFHVGADEEARYLKLTLNAMVGATSALLAEALTIARKGGLDMATTLEVLNNSAVASPLIGYKTNMLVNGDYTPAFPVSGMIKDFDIALGVGRSEHIPMPLIAQVRQTYEAAHAAGAAEEDFFVLVREAAKAAGIGK